VTATVGPVNGPTTVDANQNAAPGLVGTVGNGPPPPVIANRNGGTTPNATPNPRTVTHSDTKYTGPAYSDAPNNTATAVTTTRANWGQFGRGAISFVSGVVGAVITVAATPLSVTGIGAVGVVVVGTGSAGLITYGLGNMVAAFSPDRTQAELMASAPTSILTGIARLVGGQQAQDAVAVAESVLNFSHGMARTGTMIPNLVTRQDQLENAKNFVEMIDALNEAAKPKNPNK
jgi:hypothetical protein